MPRVASNLATTRKLLVLPNSAPIPKGHPVDYEIRPLSRDAHGRELSPFFLKPTTAVSGLHFRNVENLWQYHKVYPQLGHVADDGLPSDKWWDWLETGAAAEEAHRYPAGRGAVPAYTYWKRMCLSYVAARKAIYIPAYASAAHRTKLYHKTLADLQRGASIVIRDFDAYYTETNDWQAIINDPKRKMGHGFVLAMMLDMGHDFWKRLVI